MKVLPMKDKTDKFTIQKKELPNLPLRMLMIGGSGSGKSSLLGWLLCNRGEKGYRDDIKPENTFIFSGSLKGDYKLSQMVKFLEVPEDNLFGDFDNDVLNELYDGLVDDFNDPDQEKEHKLIVFDDLGYQNVMNKRVAKSSIDKLFCNGRKYLISSMILNQRIIQVNPTCLANASAIIAYKPNNRDLELYDSNFNYLPNKDQFKRLIRRETQNKHDYIIIDFSKDEIYRNKSFELIKMCNCAGKLNQCGGFK
tara:strand:- start:209 stop:964 length:756 start_codon:yes stop_codon:yes gene_type:complete